MRAITYYIHKETKEEFTTSRLFIEHREDFETMEEYNKWVEENFEEREKFVGTPYERTRAMVYATNNRWAIENFNATHN